MTTMRLAIGENKIVDPQINGSSAAVPVPLLLVPVPLLLVTVPLLAMPISLMLSLLLLRSLIIQDEIISDVDSVFRRAQDKVMDSKVECLLP